MSLRAPAVEPGKGEGRGSWREEGEEGEEGEAGGGRGEGVVDPRREGEKAIESVRV